MQNANTAGASGTEYTGWCLDKEDLCVAKLCANREKDVNFVHALLGERLVDGRLIAERLTTVLDRYSVNARRAERWLAAALRGLDR